MNNNQQKILQAIASILIIIFLILIIMLKYEFNRCHQEINHLIVMRDEYQNYVLALKRLITESRQQLDNETGMKTEEKKKFIMPEGQEIWLNRDGEYLKRSALNFARQHNLYEAIAQLYSADDFVARTRNMQNHTARLTKTKRRNKKNTRLKAQVDSSPAWWEQLKKEPIFITPIAQGDFWISSRFGPRKNADGSCGFHHAIDFAAVRGTPVKAAASGIVLEAGYTKGYGNTVLIVHNRKFKTRYAHLERIFIRVGAKVEAGTIIGKVGDTGYVRKRGRDASHLHFEVHVFGKRVNPLYFFA